MKGVQFSVLEIAEGRCRKVPQDFWGFGVRPRNQRGSRVRSARFTVCAATAGKARRERDRWLCNCQKMGALTGYATRQLAKVPLSLRHPRMKRGRHWLDDENSEGLAFAVAHAPRVRDVLVWNRHVGSVCSH